MEAPFKIAIRKQDDGFVHAYIEHLEGKTIGERHEVSTISVGLATDPETFKAWQNVITGHLDRALSAIGIKREPNWKSFTLPEKN